MVARAAQVLLLLASRLAAAVSLPLDAFRLEDQTFCTGDRAAPARASQTAAACAALVPADAWGFEWDCGGKKPGGKACVVLARAADCGHLKRSSCGSQVYINKTAPLPPPAPPPAAPLPPVKPVYDVSVFESLVPKWIAQYRLRGSVANFSFSPGGSIPHPYAPSDVLHVLCGTGQLGTLSASDRAAYATQITAFQRPDGFFDAGDADGHPGGSLWHAAGYVTAGLSILGAQPAHNNEMFEKIASTPSLWEPTVHALLHADDVLPPMNVSSGCSEGYACAQNIASLASWWIQTNASTGGLVRHSAFLSWYYEYLRAQTDPETGLWCIPSQVRKHGEMNCIGGSFHIDFVMQHVVMFPRHAPPGTDASFAYAARVLNNSLALENKRTGGWTPNGMAYLNVDGMYQATRPSLQLGKARWDEVERSCDRLMALVTAALNDESKVVGGSLAKKSHNLPALIGAVAECGKQFPAMIKSTRPWKACLDDVPYI
jgi:hypothetical protein